jgi:hypothetical protein
MVDLATFPTAIEAAIRLKLTIVPRGINAGIGVSKRDVEALQEKERER